MPTLADVAHHLEMAREGADSIRESADVPRSLVELDDLLEKTEAVDEALYRLGDRLDPCGAPSPEGDSLVPPGLRCTARRHAKRRNHEATVGEDTYSWPWAPEGD